MALRGAGRTDAGVHALGQVAHFDLARAWPVDTVRAAVNFHLRPDPIAILDCAVVADDFDARFSATGAPLPLSHPGAAGAAGARSRPGVVGAAADAHRADAGGGRGIGRPARFHDLPRRRLPGQIAGQDARSAWRSTAGGEEIHIAASARSFLHNQVRSMVGSLKLVGEGKWRAADLGAALEARHRAACGPVAPARGLYLVRVDYAEGTK